MNQHFKSIEPDARSETLKLAGACLAGRREWKGSVKGLGGLLNRRFRIISEGDEDGESIEFREVMTFDNGETQKRQWRIIEGHGGPIVEGEDIETLRPGRIEAGAFVIDYSVRFGGMRFAYQDRFQVRADGRVSNAGIARLFGIPLMMISAEGSAPK